MKFCILGAMDLLSAYCTAFDIILSHLNEINTPTTTPGEVTTAPTDAPSASATPAPVPQWSDNLLSSAKSSAIFELIELENTPWALAHNSLIDYYRETPKNFNRAVMKRITRVTMDEVKLITKKYFKPLFINTTTCAVAAPKEEVPGIIKGLME